MTVNYPASGDRVLDNAVTSADARLHLSRGDRSRLRRDRHRPRPGTDHHQDLGHQRRHRRGRHRQLHDRGHQHRRGPYAAATLSALLAGVLDDAAYNGDAAASGGALSFAGTTLDWTGALHVNATVVITFSVTANALVTGDGVLDAQVTSAMTGSTCPAGGADPGCSSSITVAPTSIAVTDLISEFTLTGLPDTTVRGTEAVTMTVTTNSVNGYTVTARANSPELVP